MIDLASGCGMPFRTTGSGSETDSQAIVKHSHRAAASVHLQAFQHRLQVPPEAFDRRYLDALVGTVRIDNRRAKGGHLHSGVLFSYHATLQAGVHRNELRSLAEDILMCGLELLHDFAFRLRLPTGVAAGVLRLEARQAAGGCDHACQPLLAALDRTALA